jgi:hypothetical protein
VRRQCPIQCAFDCLGKHKYSQVIFATSLPLGIHTRAQSLKGPAKLARSRQNGPEMDQT